MTRFFLLDVLRGWVGVGNCPGFHEAGSVSWLGFVASMVLTLSAQFCNALRCQGFAFVRGL